MKNYVLALGLVAGFGIASANAAGLTHEISAAVGAYTLGLNGGTATHNITLNGNYYYSVDRNFQVGLNNEFSWTNPNPVALQPIVMLGLTMMGSDIRDDVFLRAGAGINYALSTVNFAMRFELGKRFALTDSVSWTPYVSSSTVLNSGTAISFVPVAFSLFL